MGGHAYVGYTKRDAQNQGHRDALKQIANGDAATALAFLEMKKKKEKNFFLEHTEDAENRVTKVFWADSMSITDYSCFGDLLLFDATYKKNIYNMPLVIFAGVNHHNQTCIFACALLQHERTDNYEWALETLTKAMGNKFPETVITDEDQEMAKAIKKVFPSATHRLCSWHLQTNIVNKTKNAAFGKEWNKFVDYDYGTEAQFDKEWEIVVNKHDLQGNKWVAELKNKHSQWARTYLRKVFVANNKTSSRCEGLNAQILFHIKQKNNLFKFFTNFEIWMGDLREAEIKEDYKSIYCSPELRSTGLGFLEKSASELFTVDAFIRIRKVLEASSGCIRENKTVVGDIHRYNLSMFSPKGRDRVVDYDTKTKMAVCDCCAFLYTGLPCKHMIFVLKEEKEFTIPESFVKHRWSKNPKRIETIETRHMDERQLLSHRYGLLQYSAIELFQLGALSTESCKFVQEEVKKICDKLRDAGNVPTEMPTIEIPENIKGIKNPTPVAHKGSGVKKGQKGQRPCGKCGEKGHYQSRCPKRQKTVASQGDK
ncbi:Protein FAR1-RELATED SEQUENCE 5 [Linum grandiflorum]